MALPQPRSRMALAAVTRAAGVASLLRMIWTRILSADRVWLRASERISVIDLGIRECSLIFGGRQRPINRHFAARYERTIGRHSAVKSVNMAVIRLPHRCPRGAGKHFL